MKECRIQSTFVALFSIYFKSVRVMLGIESRDVRRAGFGHKFVKMFRTDFGPACKTFL